MVVLTAVWFSSYAAVWAPEVKTVVVGQAQIRVCALVIDESLEFVDPNSAASYGCVEAEEGSLSEGFIAVVLKVFTTPWMWITGS